MPALFTRKRRYVTAGPYGSSTGKSPLNFTNEHYCPTTNPPCCSSLHPPGQTFLPEQAIRDPFILEFLNLKDEYSESDLEDALLSHLMDFMLELGDDFAFVGRQRRLRIDDSWFRVDLLFFHRRLRCLLLVDLKVGKFGYADAGQMNMYLNYAKEHWTMPGEKPASRPGFVRRERRGGSALRADWPAKHHHGERIQSAAARRKNYSQTNLFVRKTMLETQLTRGGSLTTEKN
ncbi:protein yhcG [Salmonella enterica subsp. enterica]|uniref:Protein yhcG n=1 Tax=Salmonella enterica I TaxID=59201 RepID=A0A3S4IPG8_SALET|nr:protein yhcG [Salmonella enterica subsp. enterica]